VDSLNAVLALETGRVFVGRSFGAVGETSGEVVFCTALAGYQEILTDPSYQGQIVMMTYPHIGNYGTFDALNESRKPFAAGFIAREFSDVASHSRSTASLAEYMKKHGVVGIDGLDTRALTRHLRQLGVCRGIISTGNVSPKKLIERAKKTAPMAGRDLVSEVSCSSAYEWRETGEELEVVPPSAGRRKVVVMDFGVKRNTLDSLVRRGCDVTVVPAQTTAQEILTLQPSGVLFSNGPGDPAAVTYAIETVKRLIGACEKGQVDALFGICLGHQLLGLALGGKTFKLKFGHRGANHPVKELSTGKVEVTTQNHGFCVDVDSLAAKEVELTHINLNDRTLEGFRHKKLPIFAVQYHPESSPGPHDSRYLFDRFVSLMK